MLPDLPTAHGCAELGRDEAAGAVTNHRTDGLDNDQAQPQGPHPERFHSR